MEVIEVIENKKAYIELLLLADEQEDMIDRYLDKGKMYLLDDNGIKFECVVTNEGDGVLEINFFTDNYANPIYENGVQLVDMVYLQRAL